MASKLFIAIAILLVAHKSAFGSSVLDTDFGEPQSENDSFQSRISLSSRSAINFLGKTIVSIPFGKILMVAGALFGLFLLFVRMLIVVLPIIFLGMLTRESTDLGDILRIILEFYTSTLSALDT